METLSEFAFSWWSAFLGACGMGSEVPLCLGAESLFWFRWCPGELTNSESLPRSPLAATSGPVDPAAELSLGSEAWGWGVGG